MLNKLSKKQEALISVVRDEWLNNFFSLEIVSRPPTFINRDEKYRLHSTYDYAIVLKDGYGLHYVHGVFFSPELFNQFFKEKSFTGKDILQLKNTEQKAVLIQHYGYQQILSDVNAKVIDTYKTKSKVTQKPVICELIEFQLDNTTLRLVKVEDHSVHKITTLGVPIEDSTKTCLGALAWTFGMKEEEYNLLVET